MGRTDEELMSEFQQGAEAPFITLYERYKIAIYRFIYRKIGHQARAEELTQEVFLALIRYRKEWRNQSSFKTYLYRIAFNCCASEARRAEHRIMVAGDEEQNSEVMRTVQSETPSPATEVEQQEAGKHVRNALQKLEPEYRDALIMREYEGLSYEEISIVLDIPVGTVKSRIFRGKLELKRLLAPLLGIGLERAADASIS